MIYFLTLLLGVAVMGSSYIKYEDFFTDDAMRVDYFHVGDYNSEFISIDEIKKEPFFAGSKKNLIDPFPYGKYKFEVFDHKTKKLIYSRGFSTLFGEWQTTPQAKKEKKVMHETVIFPFPKNKVILKIYSRDKKWKFQKIFETTIDPSSHLIVKGQKYKNFETIKVLYNGSPSNKVDIVFVGDGYTKDEVEKYKKDVKRFTDILFMWEPFKSRKKDFNVWAVVSISNESGVSEPRKGIFKDTVIGTSFNTFDTPRYLTTLNNKTLRDIAGLVPYDAIYVIVNTGRYGGAGIYNQFAIFVSDNEYDDYVAVHEFGHSFAALGDEYYSSQVAYSDFYPKGIEPWEPNITALLDKKHIKWGHLIKKGTPIPTPPDRKKYSNTVGCYEGAGYAAVGLFRPYIDCKMFSKAWIDFCPVCQDAINKMIDYYVK